MGGYKGQFSYRKVFKTEWILCPYRILTNVELSNCIKVWVWRISVIYLEFKLPGWRYTSSNKTAAVHILSNRQLAQTWTTFPQSKTTFFAFTKTINYTNLDLKQKYLPLYCNTLTRPGGPVGALLPQGQSTAGMANTVSCLPGIAWPLPDHNIRVKSNFRCHVWSKFFFKNTFKLKWTLINKTKCFVN